MSLDILFGLVFAGILGAVIGSFENVLILRWHESVSLMGRSACPGCGKKIRARHLVPILSWLWLRGRCADCGKKIHFQYPLVEATAMLLALAAAYRHPPLTDGLLFAFEFIVTVGLIVPVVMDLRWQEIPLEYLVGLGIIAGGFHIALALLTGGAWLPVVMQLVFALAIGIAVFGVQFVLSRGKWIGEGDIWFGGVMGAILGTPALTGVGIYLAYILGGLMALVGILLRIYKRGSRLPFAPALAAGTILALWHGETILRWFMRGF